MTYVTKGILVIYYIRYVIYSVHIAININCAYLCGYYQSYAIILILLAAVINYTLDCVIRMYKP